MTSKIEVPPCECGSTDVSIGYESPQGYWVECGDCGYQTEKSHSREQVIAKWYTRVAPAVEHQPESVYQVEYLGDGGGGWSDVEYREFKAYQGKSDFRTRILYAAPLSPDHSGGAGKVVLPEQVEIVAQTIYEQWASTQGYVPWVVRGNSLKQDEARRIAWGCLDKVKELNQ